MFSEMDKQGNIDRKHNVSATMFPIVWPGLKRLLVGTSVRYLSNTLLGKFCRQRQKRRKSTDATKMFLNFNKKLKLFLNRAKSIIVFFARFLFQCLPRFPASVGSLNIP